MYMTGMEPEGVSLQDLATLAIGTPEVGAVNFTALHTLLHAFIKHLQIQNVSVQLPCGTGQHPPSGGVLVLKEKNGQVDRMENRILHLEKQLEALNTLPSGLDLIEISKSGQERGSGAVEDMWQILQLKKRLEVNEEGVSKAMAVLQDLMLEVNTIKGSQLRIEDQIQNMTDTAALKAMQTLEQKHGHGKNELEMGSLAEELELLKTQMMELEETFKVFHETLARRPGTKLRDNDNSRMYDPIQHSKLSHQDGPILTTSQMTESLTQGSLQAEDSALLVETPHVAQDGMTTTTLKDTEIEMSGEQHERDLTHAAPAAPVPHNTEINPTMTGMDRTAAPGSPGATSQEYAVLHTRIEGLEKGKADRSELGLLQKNTDELVMTVQDLQETLCNLNGDMQDMRGDADTDLLQRRKDPTMTSQNSDQTLEDTSLRTIIQEIENDLKELRKSQKLEKSLMEHTVGDKEPYLQDQDGKLFAHIQKTMKQLQEECERLDRTTGSLIQDHEQKQQHIDVLYQTVANLDKNKVDKEPIGLETDVVKADKRALESKLGRTHFDASTEHLSRMMQELLGKVSAQEQDWQRLLEKINVEMQNKLDRMELEPMKNILEQCWRDLRGQLQEHPPLYEADEAAGIRKQLIQRFHCISCNRVVDMVVPGPEILTIPNNPGLPARGSSRPYTVFELDQVRHHSRSDRLPPLSDFGYTSSSRNCGGSHTLTFPQRRYSRLQASTPCTVEKEDFMGDLKGDVFILGQDGHIYRGRRDKHSQTLETKDGKKSTVAHQKLCDCNLKGE
ncbi:glutamine-rich protein 2 [Ranitomeya variabilis]|uniref:glutamine-rich protein 2 n=1 Tax=Ranitomeya variabilis TaxID=490064 RepID=UPI00405703D6